MRNFLILGVLLLSSCASTQPLSKKPVDALIPELPFSYQKGGSFISAKGIGAAYFSVGDPKVIKVKTNRYAGDCQLIMTDGDTNLTRNCSGLSEVVLNLGRHYKNQPEVIGISVVSQNLTTQLGWFYPSLRTKRVSLPVSFKCPQQSNSEGLQTCTRPATFAFNFSANITDNFPGKIQYTYACDNVGLVTQIKDITAPGAIPYTLNSGVAQFCQIRLDVIQNLQADGTYSIKKSSTISVRFYDPQYIPLPMPIISGHQVCAAEDYSAISINGVDDGSLRSGKCVTFDGTIKEVIAWDSIGRVSWAVPGSSSSMLSTEAVRRRNEYKFYQDARPWVESEMKKCGLTEACARKVIYSSKMKSAVRHWDASRLYR